MEMESILILSDVPNQPNPDSLYPGWNPAPKTPPWKRTKKSTDLRPLTVDEHARYVMAMKALFRRYCTPETDPGLRKWAGVE